MMPKKSWEMGQKHMAERALTPDEAEQEYEDAPDMPLTEAQKERILRMAEAESNCESVSVGGLAVDVGFSVHSDPRRIAREALEKVSERVDERVLLFHNKSPEEIRRMVTSIIYGVIAEYQ